MEETRFAMLRPQQIISRRSECPVAYVPLGTLEWHGLHNPIGADGLQAEAISLRCAEKGGVVFPTVYYGESRVNSLLETDLRYQKGVAERLGILPDLLKEDRFPYSGMEQIEHYQHHLIHIIAEIASYGFRLVVFIVGHYPLLSHAKSAILLYNQWAYDKQWERIGGIVAVDALLLKDLFENAGDHAGGWETSHLLASHPETVDLGLAEDDMQFGILSKRNPKNASAGFGQEIYQAAADAVIKKVQAWLKDPKAFMNHMMDAS